MWSEPRRQRKFEIGHSSLPGAQRKGLPSSALNARSALVHKTPEPFLPLYVRLLATKHPTQIPTNDSRATPFGLLSTG